MNVNDNVLSDLYVMNVSNVLLYLFVFACLEMGYVVHLCKTCAVKILLKFYVCQLMVIVS